MRTVLIIVITIASFSFYSSCKKDDLSRSERKPIIDSISPTFGTKGTSVSILGSGFGNIKSDVTVFLNGKIVSSSFVSDSKIKFIVPPKSGSGLVSVSVVGNSASGPAFTFIYTVTVSTFSGQPGIAGFADGNPASVKFNQPRGLSIDANGNLYVADVLNNRIRRISTAGDAVTFAGSGIAGHQDGLPGVSRFNNPYDIQLDLIHGNFYVADKLNHCIRRISMAGDVTTAAGIPGSPGYVDAPGLSARMNNPTGVALEGELTNIYIADSENHCIRRLDSFNVLSTFAGSTTDGQQDGFGNAAKFSSPYDIDWDSTGYLFVSDIINQNIRRIKKSNVEVTTVAGNGTTGWFDGPGNVAWFNSHQEYLQLIIRL